MKHYGISNSCFTASCILEQMARKIGITVTTSAGYLCLMEPYLIRHIWNDYKGVLVDVTINAPPQTFQYKKQST